ncbi:MAG TPA: cytochrome c-type biogenesis protein CcmH [Acidimicrobiales bacterium]|nr:cytochrome c-type biogenesis protein CcmH [Acidimicrobiales bacterium]
MRRWFSYAVLLVIVCTALFLGTGRGDGPATAAERADHISSEVRCPTCEGLSAAESESPASLAIRKEIRRRVDSGQSDDEIRSFLVGRYGHDILLRPGATGIAALVWALPVAVLVCALAGLAVAFRRWRARAALDGIATPDDRLLVDQALHR